MRTFTRSIICAVGFTIGWTARGASVELITGVDGVAVGGEIMDVSPDGRYVLFFSRSSRYVAGDTNGVNDAFLRDRTLGTTVRANVSSTGAQANDGSLYDGVVTPDGRYVAFTTSASNLVMPNDTFGYYDVLVRDLLTGTTERASVTSSGEPGSYYPHSPSLSDDGRFVVFSGLDTFANGAAPHHVAVLLRDRVAKRTSDVGLEAFPCRHGRISGNGRYVLFTTETYGDDTDADGTQQVYLRDLATGSVTHLTTYPQTRYRNNNISEDISADGRYVVISTNAPVVPDDTNGTFDVYLLDRVSGIWERVNLTDSDVQGNAGARLGSVSDDGRYVSFGSGATDLVSDDTNGRDDLFVRDRVAGTTVRVNLSPYGGGQTQLVGTIPHISRNGRFVAFNDLASFWPTDLNGGFDGFLYSADGTAPPPTFTFTLRPRLLDFGVVPVGGTSATLTATLTNTSKQGLPIKWIGLAGTHRAEFVRTRHCPGTLAAGQKCTITVAFIPETAGEKIARLVVSAGGTRKSVSLSGTGR